MGDTFSSPIPDPQEILGYKLTDLQSADSFIEKHRSLYKIFFDERWYEDNIKLKAVLFLYEYFNVKTVLDIRFTTAGYIFNYFGISNEREKEGNFFPIYNIVPDYNKKRYLILKYIEKTSIIDEQILKSLTYPTLLNEICKDFFKVENMEDIKRFIELIKLYYIFSVISRKEVDIQNIDFNNEKIFFDYLVHLNSKLKIQIKIQINSFLKEFEKENFVF